MKENIKFARDEWMHVCMEHGIDGETRARQFFNASATAKVEWTEYGYRV